LIWAEELAAWRHLDDCWDHMRFGLRAGPRPHWVGSTTPKPKPLIKKLAAGEIRNVELTTGITTYDNPHLPQHIRDALEETYAGTQLGSQELLGKIMEEDENALWTRSMIEAARVLPDAVPDLVKITVGVDPSGGAGEQGIVVAGKSGLVLPGNGGRPQAHGYVLDDRTCHLSPDGWGRRAVQAAIDWEADEIVAETNYGGAMCVATLRTAADALGVSIPIKTVTATRGKAVRAQPVSALTAQGRWHHAGTFEALEDQLCTWHPEIGWSPDRLDAMVWTTWQMKLAHTTGSGQGSSGAQAAQQNIGGVRVR
jgi:phage terminase large subunit-like protein